MDRKQPSRPHKQQLALSEEGAWAALPTPKIRGRASRGVLGWAHAYAGFSYDFAAAAVRMLKVGERDRFLDPFVGSGTSALAAVRERSSFVGIDLDPFSALLTRAKLAVGASEAKVRGYLRYGSRAIESGFAKQAYDLFPESDLRYATGVFRRILSSTGEDSSSLWPKLLSDIKGDYDSEVVALACVVLCARACANVVRGSNPVWLRQSLAEESSNRPSLETTARGFMARMLEDLSAFPSGVRGPATRIVNSDFQRANLRPASVDRVITSPPYLNRLDYIISHLPELVVLSGFLPINIEPLRQGMIGTTKMLGDGKGNHEWGTTCLSLLDEVYNHPSKASSTYYYKFYCQYFAGLFATLTRLRRVCRKGATGLLVIQDSYYKNIRIPIVIIMKEMGLNIGFTIDEVRTEDIRGHIGTMSPIQTAYVPDKTLREHVLHLSF